MGPGFTFFPTFYQVIRGLPDEQRLALYDAMCAFAFDGVEPDLPSPLNSFFLLMCPNLQASMRNRKNGQLGGRTDKADALPKPASKPPCKPASKPPSEAIGMDKDMDRDMDMDVEVDKECCFAILTDSSSSRERACAREEAAVGAAGDPPEENPFGDRDGPRPSFDTVEAYAANNLAALTPGNMEELVAFKGDLPEALIRHAIDEAAANGKRTWNYARSILRRYVEADYKTLGEALDAEEKHKRKGGAASDGVDREIDSDSEWDSLDPERRRIFELAVANGD